MIRFLIFMSNLTFLIFSNFRLFFIKHLRQKRHLLNMFSRKCQVQNDRINWQKISCFCQKLDLTLYFTIKTSIFKLRPLFRFLCLINSFYRRYVSCIYNIYPIYPIYPIDIQYIQYILQIHRLISNFFRSVTAKKTLENQLSSMSRRHIYILSYFVSKVDLVAN